MLTALSVMALGSLARQGHAISFLAYQDTIFATRQRNGWASPPRLTDFLSEEVPVVGLGLTSVKTVCKARYENWDNRTESFNLACEDFDDVMGWLITPNFPRHLMRRPELSREARLAAAKILLQRQVGPVVFKDPNVFSIDLDGTGRQETLVDISGKAAGHSHSLVFLINSFGQSQLLAYSKDGWLRLLTVVSLDRDMHMQIIAGGPTTIGKFVGMWQYDHGKIIELAHYETPK